jgi:hypothetical protein
MPLAEGERKEKGETIDAFIELDVGYEELDKLVRTAVAKACEYALYGGEMNKPCKYVLNKIVGQCGDFGLILLICLLGFLLFLGFFLFLWFV